MRILFSPAPFNHSAAPRFDPVVFLEGELIEHNDGTVEIQRLFDAPEDQQTSPPSTAMSRTLGITFEGDPVWRPAGTHGSFETGYITAYGVAYKPSHGTPDSVQKPCYIVPVVIMEVA